MDPLSILTVLIPLAVAGLALVTALISRGKLNELHVLINSRLSELIAANSRAERASGIAEGGMDAAGIQAVVRKALAEALATPPPPVSPILRTLSIDTNQRVHEIQADASAVATALAVKTAKDDHAAQDTVDTAAALIATAAQVASDLVVKTAADAVEPNRSNH